MYTSFLELGKLKNKNVIIRVATCDSYSIQNIPLSWMLSSLPGTHSESMNWGEDTSKSVPSGAQTVPGMQTYIIFGGILKKANKYFHIKWFQEKAKQNYTKCQHLERKLKNITIFEVSNGCRFYPMTAKDHQWKCMID